mmetsp:Transcript_11785/g.23492  ORF Transcript_11785/g.23492 Transcript_11785/m.23492 type:complete len:129 (-) Transcript_11785:496-882(-)
MVTEGFNAWEGGGVARCRTLTLKGFDTSDREVDLLRLAGRIATADPVPLGRPLNETNAASAALPAGNLLVHRGVLEISQDLYVDIMPHLDNAHPHTVFRCETKGQRILLDESPHYIPTRPTHRTERRF